MARYVNDATKMQTPMGTQVMYHGYVDWEGVRHGCGTSTAMDGPHQGVVEVGQFQHGLLNGYALQTFTNGDQRASQFRDGRCHGNAVYISRSGVMEHETWAAGEEVACSTGMFYSENLVLSQQ
jgi:hypothetical protein